MKIAAKVRTLTAWRALLIIGFVFTVLKACISLIETAKEKCGGTHQENHGD
jgi:hypothetical protein